MLARYQIIRGKRPPDKPLPEGVRQDTRKHTKHFLRPTKESVAGYLAQPDSQAWEKFSKLYRQNLEKQFKDDRTPFDELAELATQENVYLGCSCPTAKNPDVNHCHTVEALRFMQEHYPELTIQFP